MHYLHYLSLKYSKMEILDSWLGMKGCLTRQGKDGQQMLETERGTHSSVILDSYVINR